MQEKDHQQPFDEHSDNGHHREDGFELPSDECEDEDFSSEFKFASDCEDSGTIEYDALTEFNLITIREALESLGYEVRPFGDGNSLEVSNNKDEDEKRYVECNGIYIKVSDCYFWDMEVNECTRERLFDAINKRNLKSGPKIAVLPATEKGTLFLEIVYDFIMCQNQSIKDLAVCFCAMFSEMDDALMDIGTDINRICDDKYPPVQPGVRVIYTKYGKIYLN